MAISLSRLEREAWAILPNRLFAIVPRYRGHKLFEKLVLGDKNSSVLYGISS
jgi:hypothetical protein